MVVTACAREAVSMETTAPVAALTILGNVLAVLGLFVAGNIQLVIVGLLAIFAAGVLQVLGARRRA
jgi:hypothetical protein